MTTITCYTCNIPDYQTLMGNIRRFVTFLLLLSSSSVLSAGLQVEIRTNLGNITLELYPDKAPKTVANFVQYVNEGFYKDTVFHRVIPGFMIQGGGFTKELAEKPTRKSIENEAANTLSNETGSIAMARTGDPHSATAQFFINLANNDFLNYSAPTVRGYGYTVFGKIIKGANVVTRIASLPTGAGGPFPEDLPQEIALIQDIRILTPVDVPLPAK
jgi:cyclophilin family peptidyl-prolyl cis-trans isomerase